ncbi:MAG: poly-beta-1,6-N-acetyl-D-glucosamine biosynthesis protein PgaD [Hydrotalea sp.]|nr:poly-beta-1,6-N-acetyl-D-glucosamine biosynthesis protein PgaD [Hydrotalea sp.]
MDQPRQGFEVNRSLEQYIIQKAKLPRLMVLRDIILTMVMWAFYCFAFYRAFLYIEELYIINELTKLSKQQKVVLADFYADLRIYLIILLGLIIYITVRLVSNLGKWKRMRKNTEISLPTVTAQEQALFFKANEEDIVMARNNKICVIETSSEDGSVLSVEILK